MTTIIPSTFRLASALFALALSASSLFAERLTVLPTGSMAPAIPATGAVINYDTRPFASVQAGDVIIFRRAGSAKGYTFALVIHRVVKVVKFANGETAFVTKGDANKSRDAGYVTQSEYIGAMTGFAN